MGQEAGATRLRLWGLTGEQLPLSNFTIGIDRIDVMVAKMQEMPGWPIYKIKLGTQRTTWRSSGDCASTPTPCFASMPIAAGRWTKRFDNARELKPLGVEFIEQPLPADQWEDSRRLKADSAVADDRRRKLHPAERRGPLRRAIFTASISSWSSAAG